MRDPKRITRLLKIIKQIWEQNPDLRLMQLLGNCFPPQDNYNQEDDKLEQLLKKNYKVT